MFSDCFSGKKSDLLQFWIDFQITFILQRNLCCLFRNSALKTLRNGADSAFRSQSSHSIKKVVERISLRTVYQSCAPFARQGREEQFFREKRAGRRYCYYCFGGNVICQAEEMLELGCLLQSALHSACSGTYVGHQSRPLIVLVSEGQVQNRLKYHEPSEVG